MTKTKLLSLILRNSQIPITEIKCKKEPQSKATVSIYSNNNCLYEEDFSLSELKKIAKCVLASTDIDPRIEGLFIDAYAVM